MFFDTPWTRLSDSQKQKGISPINSRPTASEYFGMGPVRGIGEQKPSYNYNCWMPSHWKKEQQPYLEPKKFIEINGKEIY